MSPQQQLSDQLAAVFQLCDPGGSGYITLDTLLQLGRDYGLSEECELRQQLAVLDPGGSGRIAQDAFCRGVSALLLNERELESQISRLTSPNDHHPREGRSIVQREHGSSGASSEPHLQPTNKNKRRHPRCTSSIRRTSEVKRSSAEVMLSVETSSSSPSFLVTTSPSSLAAHDEEGGSLTDMDSALGSSSPSQSLEIDAKGNNRNNNSSSSQCSSMSDGESYECVGEGSPAAASPLPAVSVEPGINLRRNTWSRSSLRRTPQSSNASPASGEAALGRRWGSFRHSSKRVGSNALVSPLYRSASFNSSGRSSNCGDADDMYCSDNSLEDDVMGLNRKVHMLQQQVSALADTQNNTDDRYSRARQENGVLQARVLMLEEQLREEQLRAEERLSAEQRRHKDIMARLDREKQLELENAAIRLQGAERKSSSLEEEVGRLRSQAERHVASKRHTEEILADLELQLQTLRTEHVDLKESSTRQREDLEREGEANAQVIEEMSRELQTLRLKARSPPILGTPLSPSAQAARGSALETEVRELREKNRSLQESLEEVQAQLLSRGVEEGRTLLGEPGLAGTSLADELEAMSADKHGQGSQTHMAQQVRLALREQQDVNLQLRAYIDGILLNIVENYPQLLEVKHK